MAYETRVIALSRFEAQSFGSNEPYVVISLTDSTAEHPYIEQRQGLRDRLTLQFDDVYPTQCFDSDGTRRYFEMTEQDAHRIARFVERWWGEVATIVVHCHAGLSRSTGVAAAIRLHHEQDERDLYEAPRSPNGHCLALVADALKRKELL
jgi:predicted protein tyrosine phosphatase